MPTPTLPVTIMSIYVSLGERSRKFLKVDHFDTIFT